MAYTMLIDTSTLMYRAFFALPPSIADQEGRPINAAHGYLDMIARLQSSYRPDRIIHVFDHDWRPAPRVAAYPPYKADRPDDPPELPPQFTRLREVLHALGADVAEAPGWEADDAIGVLCQRATTGTRIDVVTGDRDLLQLVRDDTPAVRVLMPAKGVGEMAVFDEAAVVAKYGIPSDRYVDFATLRGDPSDGLPGVKGIGEKTARTLVERYPSLDALLDDVASLTPRLAASLRDAASYLAAMCEVVPIRSDVTIELSSPPPDQSLLDELATRYRLAGPIGRLRAAETDSRDRSIKNA